MQSANQNTDPFVERLSLAPTARGSLDGLRFAVKDLIDVAARKTGCGNPSWLATHPPAAVSAVSVELLLAAGAGCEGKTITDEVAFSLIGENYFYGTPLNPAAPLRVPGGSSSGSASAVASGFVDFALGTDTGGSVRVPASNCGVWGLRPSHGIVSVAGVVPFAPGFDTVGVLASRHDVLQRSAAVLLASEPSSGEPRLVHLVKEAFELLDPDVQQALEAPINHLRRLYGDRVHETSLAELCRDVEAANPAVWHETYCTLQWAEIDSSLGAWLAESRPTFGPATTNSFKLVKGLDRTRIGGAARRRERFCRQMNRTLASSDLLCIPTAPAIAPLKGSGVDRSGNYYRRALALTSIAGICRLPQVSMPLAAVSGAPLGLSLLAAHGEDMHLLHAAGLLAAQLNMQ